jgi:hypothetical protein
MGSFLIITDPPISALALSPYGVITKVSSEERVYAQKTMENRPPDLLKRLRQNEYEDIVVSV